MFTSIYLTHCRTSFPQDAVEAKSLLRAQKEVGPVNGKEIHKKMLNVQKYQCSEVAELKVVGAGSAGEI